MTKDNPSPKALPKGALEEEVVYAITTTDRDDQHPPVQTEISSMVTLCRKLLPAFGSGIVAGFGVRHDMLAKALWVKLRIGRQIPPNEVLGKAGQPSLAEAWLQHTLILNCFKADLPGLCLAVTDKETMRVLGVEEKEAFPFAVYEVRRQTPNLRGYKLLGRIESTIGNTTMH